MSDMEAEVEEVSFLPGEKILNKKAVYEPSSSQRCRQLVCSRQWAVAILITMGLFLIVIAIIAAFARPGSILCLNLTDGQNASKADASASSSASQSKVKHYISTDGRPFPWKNIRLPRTVLPDFYEIFLHPNISQSQFTGTIKIHSSVVNSTDFIVFHIKELNVTSVAVLRGEVAVKLSDRMEYKENEQLYIKLEQPLAADSKIIIMVQFKGALVSKLAGFYKSTYKTAVGEAREIATTHFEPTDARTAFPCFDEPDMKANFSLSIIRESQHITLFNMPLMKTAAYGDGLLRDDYQTSVKMSTYLVAFVVCDFKNVSAYTKSNTLVRVFAPEDQISQAVYALNVSVKVLDYYNEFFGIPYPLPKQDMIAIPDFAAGAMENWGLITYRMTSILYDAEKSSTSSKQWITIVIAHELAHQWFGNLVTMQWWNDLWLNEGFASFVEYIGADVAEPFFGMEEQFLYETLQTALYLDCFANSHPIQVPVKDPAEINEIFDKISYDKGASLISMLQGVLGKETFKKGLHNYLTTHVYQNAETYDLWQSLQEVSDMKSGMTVREVMDTWTLQMGYPVITVKRKPGTNHLLVSQTRFLLSDSTNEESKFHSPFNYTWKVPLTYFTNSNHQETQLAWLTEKEMTLPVSLGDNAWIKFNRDTYGFYRVNYEPSLWRLIIKQLKENLTVFSVRDRTGLLDDAFALARAGLLSYNIVFELVSYLNRETEYIAMATAVSAYGFIESRMYLNKVYPKLQKYMLSLTSHVMKDLGWKLQENHLQKLLQTSLLSYAVNCEDKDSIEQAKELFKDWARIPKNLKSLVYAVGVKYGDDDNWLAMFNNFSTSNVPTEKKQFLIALTETADPRRIQIFLQDSLDSKVVRSQDSDTVIGHIANTPSGHLFAWRFVQRNWKTLFKRYGQTSFILSGILKSVVAPFNTQFDYDEVTEFFKGKDLASANMALKQSLEVVKSHIDWMARYEESIASWFIKNVNTVDS